MNNILNKKLLALPQKPGVYTFRDEKNKILYIGKAKSLKNRVKSYFQKSSDLTPAKQLMVSLIADIEYTITDSEREALLLETSLINKHKPPYNIMLKDDKYWQYIVLDYAGVWPQIYTVRRPDFKRKNNAQYFGPYTSGYAVKESLRLIKKIFPVCLKPPQQPLAQGTEKPCFNYHLGRCLGPCVGETTPAEYRTVFDSIKQFLIGSRSSLIISLEERMGVYSARKNYELAARVRDQITALKKLDHRQKVVLNSNESVDIINIYRDDPRIAVTLFKIRNGNVLDKFNTLLKGQYISDDEVFETFIDQYYTSTNDFPRTIIVPYSLSLTQFGTIPITRAQRGKKAQLLKLAVTNAREFLHQQDSFFDRELRKKTDAKNALTELKKELHLPGLPHRIETYDISNIQGAHAVGAMVVFENGEAQKSDYRHFTIKLLRTPDDPRMMAEMLSRRLNHLVSSSLQGRQKSTKQNLSFTKRPDLIVIDGGRTQLNAALAAQKNTITQKHKNIPMIGLAKREEEIYLPHTQDLIKLPKTSPALRLLQQTRNEAHRFGITHHRGKRTKSAFESILDDIPGIGPKTRLALLKKFKSVSGIQQASRDDLESLIGAHKADIIKKYL